MGVKGPFLVEIDRLKAVNQQLEIELADLKAITEQNLELTKRTVPDMSELSDTDYQAFRKLWVMNGSGYLISVLRHLDFLEGIPDIFSPERFSVNCVPNE